MDIQYRRELNETQMILPELAEPDCFAVRMLQENRPEHLLIYRQERTQGAAEHAFQVTGGSSLAKYLEHHAMTFEDLRELVDDLAAALQEAEELLLSPDLFRLSPNLIFRMGRGSGWKFCCHPAGRGDFFGELRSLVQYCLNRLDHSDESAVEAAYEIFEICHREYFRFEDLPEVIGRVREGSDMSVPDAAEEPDNLQTEEPYRYRVPEKTFFAAEQEAAGRRERERGGVFAILLLTGLPALALLGLAMRRLARSGRVDWRIPAAAVCLMVTGAVAAFLTARQRSAGRAKQQAYEYPESLIPDTPDGRNDAGVSGGLSADAGVTELLGGGTEVLTGDPFREPGRGAGAAWELRSPDGRERITLPAGTALIGGPGSGADITMERRTVSRRHAEITEQGGDRYIRDLSSRNGTRVRGERLTPEVWVPLREGDEIRFADTVFLLARTGTD